MFGHRSVEDECGRFIDETVTGGDELESVEDIRKK